MRRLATLVSGETLPPIAEVTAALAALSLEELPSLAVVKARQANTIGRLPDCLAALSTISTLTIAHSKVASVTIFALPPGAALPLHDHPGMHVWCRMLHGRMHDVSLDWANETIREAQVVHNGYCDPAAEPKLIEPDQGGVLHQFTADAEIGAVFIDVVSPPYYSPPDYRDCTYLKPADAAVDLAAATVGQRVLLEPWEPEVQMDALVVERRPKPPVA